MEKSYLENNYELEGKAKDRMSMQVGLMISKDVANGKIKLNKIGNIN